MSNNVTRTGPNLPGRNVTDALLQLIRNNLPGIGAGAVLTAQLLRRVVDLIRDNLSKIMGTVLTTAGLAALLPSLAVVVVNALGFTAGGVAAGSIAAVFQSIVYGGATGGIFSGLQAFGATAAVASPVVLALGGLALGAGAFFWWWSGPSGNQVAAGSSGDNDDDDPSGKGPGHPPDGPDEPSTKAMVKAGRA